MRLLTQPLPAFHLLKIPSFSFTGANTISVSDADDDLSTTKLTVSNGSLSLSIAGGATISAGKNNSNTLTLSGTQTQINAALATLTYQSAPNYYGSDTLNILSTDALVATGSNDVAITVTAVNEAPDFNAGNGIVTTPFASSTEFAKSTVIQPDGKILVAGQVFTGG